MENKASGSRVGSMWLQRAFVAFLFLTCLRVWVGPFPLLERASGQIPDSGAQRKVLIDEAKTTNLLLSEIKQLLATGTLHVRVEGADNQGASGTPRGDGK